jgi:hypothetical protein
MSFISYSEYCQRARERIAGELDPADRDCIAMETLEPDYAEYEREVRLEESKLKQWLSGGGIVVDCPDTALCRRVA